MFTNSFILWTCLYCLLPVAILLSLFLSAVILTKKLLPGAKVKLRPASALLVAAIVILVCWGVILQGVYARRSEYLFAQDLRANQVQSIVYFRNYKVTQPEQIAEFVNAFHYLRQMDSHRRPIGVTFEIKLSDGKSRVWTAGFDRGTEQVWLETETRGYYLTSPELTQACKKAKFPL